MNPTASKMQAIVEELDTELYERRPHLEAIAAAILAKQHYIAFGRPGIAKTLVMTKITERFVDGKARSFLLDRQMPLEALFGPYDVAELTNGRMVRKTEGFLPSLHFANLDEIGKSNGAVTTPMLTWLNERQFDNDGQRQDAPLMTAGAASNEYLPPELAAIDDRFLVRLVVDGIQSEANFRRYIADPLEPTQNPTTITIDELKAAQAEVAKVAVPAQVFDRLAQLRKELRENAHADPSDRRWRQSVHLMRARAFLNGRSSVNEEDIEILQHTLWEVPEHREIVAETVLSATGENRKLIVQFTRMLDDLEARLAEIGTMPLDDRPVAGKDVTAKLREITGQVGTALEDARREGSPIDQLEAIETRVSDTRSKTMRVLFEEATS